MRKRRKEGRKLRDVTVRANQKEYKIPLRQVDRTTVSSRPEFIYVIDIEDPCEVLVSDPDVNECIKKAAAEIEERLSIPWKDVIHVAVGSGEIDFFRRAFHGERDSHVLSLSWKRMQIGRRGDEPVHRDRPDRDPDDDFYREPHIYSGELREEENDADDLTYSVIDDTDENRAALESIAQAIESVRGKLREILDPKTIVATLANLNSIPLLTSEASDQALGNAMESSATIGRRKTVGPRKKAVKRTASKKTKKKTTRRRRK